MRTLSRHNKLLFTTTVFAVLLLLQPPAQATCPIKAGDVISADVLAECFANVQLDLSEAIVGTWSTQCWDTETTDIDAPGLATFTVTSLTNTAYQVDSTSPDEDDLCLFGKVDGSARDGSNTYSELKIIGDHAIIGEITVDSSGMFSTSTITWNVLELEQNRLVLTQTGATRLLLLNRQNTLPNIPTTASASASGTTVTLTWTDASTDETSFRILRKDSVTDSYAEVGTVASGSANYSETVSAGTYWYRVRSVNANGDSLGSNVVKVTVE